jgi:hypothetical protein
MRVVVSNSSPLIALSAINSFDLLRHLYGTIRIPQAVYDEVAVTGRARPGSSEVAGSSWVVSHRVKNQAEVTRLVSTSALGRGEAEAIILAGEINAELVLLDDGRARRFAGSKALDVIGTLGILLHAKRGNLIPFVKPSLDALGAVGFYIDPALYSKVVQAAGE